MADLKKLVLMLSSEFDGEVVAAARAIGERLKRSGSDWHKFADHIEQFGKSAAPKPTTSVQPDWSDIFKYPKHDPEAMQAAARDFNDAVRRKRYAEAARRAREARERQP